MPYFTAVETGPDIVVVGGDLAYITLRGPRGVLTPGRGL
jgi:3',5'-cyclic AMP phosphodiesterase CpdA